MAQDVNRVIIAPEAFCDFEAVYCLPDRLQLKVELEQYIDAISPRLTGTWYFRCKYLDEESGKLLMLFIYRSSRERVIQNWIVRGVCEAKDWTEEWEYSGQIRWWVKSSVTEFPDTDWVWRLRQEEEKKKAAHERGVWI